MTIIKTFADFDKVITDYITLCDNPIYKIKYERSDSLKICRSEFSKAIKTSSTNNDYLALILSEFLSSYGMRRNSFLLGLSYKVHIGAVDIILKHPGLLNVSTSDYLKPKSGKLMELMDLKKELAEYYEPFAKNVQKSNQLLENTFSSNPKTIKLVEPSDTLISKILLGTLGCTVAYDDYVRKSLRKGKIASSNFSNKSIHSLSKFYQNNLSEMDHLSKVLGVPDMVLLDLGFWLAAI